MRVMASVEGTQALIAKIASEVTKQVPQSWGALRVRAEVYDDNSIFEARYASSDAFSDKKSFIVSYETEKDIERLRELMKAAKGEVWKVMLLTIRHDGEFDIDFEYTDPSRWNMNPYRKYDDTQLA